MTLEAAVYQIKTETHRLVRRQNTWFRQDDGRIRWLDVSEDYMEEAEELVRGFLYSE